MGIGNALADIWRGFTDWLYVEVPPRTSVAATDAKLALDWRAVLYHGNPKEWVPLSALHTAEGSNHSMIDEQRAADAEVSSLPTRKMRLGIGSVGAQRRQTGGSRSHEQVKINT